MKYSCVLFWEAEERQEGATKWGGHRDLIKWPRARENHRDAKQLYGSQKVCCIFFKETLQGHPVFLFPWHQNLVCHSKHYQERFQSPRHWKQLEPHAQDKSWRDQCGWPPGWPWWTGWMLRGWGALIFCPSVFTCMFIRNCGPSRQPSTRFSMWATVLYYTWHLSIKEETLLKQTEVKLVLSSTSDLPLLLSSKGKFVLEQW